MNTTTRFFQTKEHYQAFRKAFASGQTDKRAHKSYTDGVALVWDSQTRKNSSIAIKVKKNGWMTSAHYLLFNLVSGRDYYNGFSPKTKATFVKGGGDPDCGLTAAITELAGYIQAAQTLLNVNSLIAPSYVKDKSVWIADKTTKLQAEINTFLEPLGGVFTLQDLARVTLPSFPGCPGNREELAGKKVTYRELFGSQVISQDEELTEVTVVEPVVVPTLVEPEKKGFFGRLVGALS